MIAVDRAIWSAGHSSASSGPPAIAALMAGLFAAGWEDACWIRARGIGALSDAYLRRWLAAGWRANGWGATLSRSTGPLRGTSIEMVNLCMGCVALAQGWQSD